MLHKCVVITCVVKSYPANLYNSKYRVRTLITKPYLCGDLNSLKHMNKCICYVFASMVLRKMYKTNKVSLKCKMIEAVGGMLDIILDPVHSYCHKG